jgi:hypothetical protein
VILRAVMSEVGDPLRSDVSDLERSDCSCR